VLVSYLLRISILALAVGCTSSPSPLCGSAWAQPAAVPADFSIRIVSASLEPPRTPPDIESIEVKASGDATLSAMPGKNGRLPATTLKISSDAVARIYKAVLEQRFFELQPLYSDQTIKDGDQAEITVTANGQTHSVRTVNIRVYAFDRITIAVDRELPIERRIQYNALHEASYKGIER